MWANFGEHIPHGTPTKHQKGLSMVLDTWWSSHITGLLPGLEMWEMSLPCPLSQHLVASAL